METVTRIPLETFLKQAQQPARFAALTARLDSYKCFVTNGGERERGLERSGGAAGGRGGHGHGHNHGRHGRYGGNHARKPTLAPTRPRIGKRELDREDICKKDFIALMNKVSPQNKEKLVQKSLAIFVPAYAPMYCNVLWALIQRPVQIYQPIYAEMARAIAMSTPMPEKLAFKSAWETCWGGISFVDLPANFSDVSKEDVFHEWSIWKKTRINLAIGCVFLCYRGVFTEPAPLLLAPLVVCVDNALINPPAAHVLDYWLDILGAIWSTLKETQQPLPHIEKLTDWAQGFTVPKCRFKVEKFIESYKNERADSKRPRHHASQGAPRS